MEFKVGDIVRLSEHSRYLGDHGNPDSIRVQGVIVEIHRNTNRGHLPIGVDWGDYKNSYSDRDLVLVNQVPWADNVLKFKFIYE